MGEVVAEGGGQQGEEAGGEERWTQGGLLTEIAQCSCELGVEWHEGTLR